MNFRICFKTYSQRQVFLGPYFYAGTGPWEECEERGKGTNLDCSGHKVLTYVEYRAVPFVFQNIDPPPPSLPSECVLPRTKIGGYTFAGR